MGSVVVLTVLVTVVDDGTEMLNAVSSHVTLSHTGYLLESAEASADPFAALKAEDLAENDLEQTSLPSTYSSIVAAIDLHVNPPPNCHWYLIFVGNEDDVPLSQENVPLS